MSAISRNEFRLASDPDDAQKREINFRKHIISRAADRMTTTQSQESAFNTIIDSDEITKLKPGYISKIGTYRDKASKLLSDHSKMTAKAAKSEVAPIEYSNL